MAQGRFQVDQTVYLISSVNWIKEAKVLKYSGGFYTIKWTDSDGGTRVRESRLYASKEEAESARDSVKRNRASNRDLSGRGFMLKFIHLFKNYYLGLHCAPERNTVLL